MTGIATFAIGLAALLALRPRQDMTDPGMFALLMVLALVLTAGVNLVLFGRRRRDFWLGFTLAGWLGVAMALTYYQETRSYILKYGPPLVRARDVLRQQHAAAAQAQLVGVNLVTSRVSEWYLLLSLIAETGLTLALGMLVASAGGLFAATVAFVARWAARLAQQSNLPHAALQRTRPAATVSGRIEGRSGGPGR
jgi:hypothetical protein